uniref:Doublecortin domain-containing protein n=1 Tax=Acrobeloides nanus TaxID=290746 RepID=A0A914D184_9BILA
MVNEPKTPTKKKKKEVGSEESTAKKLKKSTRSSSKNGVKHESNGANGTNGLHRTPSIKGGAAETVKKIKIYKNGDIHHKGINVVLNMKQKHDINAFLDVVNEKIGLVSGAKRLYTLTGQPIRSTSALEHNKAYVASSGAFTPLSYGKESNALSNGLHKENSSLSSSLSSRKSEKSTSSTLTRTSRSTEPRKPLGSRNSSGPPNGTIISDLRRSKSQVTIVRKENKPSDPVPKPRKPVKRTPSVPASNGTESHKRTAVSKKSTAATNHVAQASEKPKKKVKSTTPTPKPRKSITGEHLVHFDNNIPLPRPPSTRLTNRPPTGLRPRSNRAESRNDEEKDKKKEESDIDESDNDSDRSYNQSSPTHSVEKDHEHEHTHHESKSDHEHDHEKSDKEEEQFESEGEESDEEDISEDEETERENETEKEEEKSDEEKDDHHEDHDENHNHNGHSEHNNGHHSEKEDAEEHEHK